MRGPRFTVRHEDEATGVSAAVFADVRRRMAFVPAIFKALATDPPALERAWVQARAIVDDEGFAGACARLRDAARGPFAGGAPAGLGDALAPFAAELPGMLLIVSSLGLSLDGRLPLRPPPALGLTTGAPVPEPVVPEARGEHPVYDAVRALYGTEHVPTLYRSLAAQGLLDGTWPLVASLLGGDDGRALVDAVAAAGEREALGFPDASCFDVERTRPILDQFRIALPRNLVVAVTLGGRPEPSRRR